MGVGGGGGGCGGGGGESWDVWLGEDDFCEGGREEEDVGCVCEIDEGWRGRGIGGWCGIVSFWISTGVFLDSFPRLGWRVVLG